MWFFLLACTDADTGPVSEGPPTDTFPSFYGSVPKNVLWVSMDTTRRDQLGAYGNTDGNTPFLDSMFETGLKLEEHRACSDWTMPGMMCAITGMSNPEAGIVPDLYYSEEALMPVETPTLASRLYAEGWHTYLSTSNSWYSQDHQTTTGFEEIARPDDRSTTSVFESGLAMLRAGRLTDDQPWFLHVHIKEPHPPYNPPVEYLDGIEDLPEVNYDLTDRDMHYDAIDEWPEMTAEEQADLEEVLWFRYKAELRWMDDQLADVFSTLYAEGFLDDTMVVFFNDHGEQFWEHGDQTHAYTLNWEENDGIGLVWAPNIVTGSWAAPTIHQDFAPTVLALHDIEFGTELTGVPLGEGADDRTMDFLTAGRLGVIQSVVKSDWKLIYHWRDGDVELYDLTTDPLEKTNLYTADHPQFQALWAELQPRTEIVDAMMERYSPTAPL